MNVIETADLRLNRTPDHLSGDVQLQLIGEDGLPLLLRIFLRAHVDDTDVRMGAYLSLSGRFHGVRLAEAVHETVEARAVALALKVLEAELLDRARRWLRSWLHRHRPPPHPDGDLVSRGRRLVDELGQATDAQQRRAHRDQLAFLELVRASLGLFDDIREHNQAWLVRHSNPLGQVVAQSPTGPSLHSVPPPPEDVLAAAQGVPIGDDPEERLEQVAVDAWRRLAALDLGRAEALAAAEAALLEQVVDAYGLLLGHTVGGAVLGRPEAP
jgi:hypothetical protein